ncbi:SUMF1/EgtB/PvdO family nonheme iron enzyme [Paraburkholderia sp. D15]|uniref:SUMF1/EgtB/PvdO family nonheme iron enzyme n=1 Tax=Paraburkholderia sp. D15 TaxID=2880218 RepID=UPI0024798D1B|nr:SUMF1/EgtB/PvdO family nonheme iron enzyme [Paraburkholderia sp. D15]WGS52297.1 SUMF1/EgtB/PvdO family nonheme iron enzyme [Paraburkholderia sp. D15]
MNRDPAPLHPLVQRLIDARRITDELFAIVKPAFLYERPIRERHRIVFYIGHLEAFDRNLFDRRLFELPEFDPHLDQLFAFGIDPVDGGFPTDEPGDWPSLDSVRDYALRAREQIDHALAARVDRAPPRAGNPGGSIGSSSSSGPTESPDSATVEQLLNVAIEHRLMHAETLAYMLHQLPLDQKVSNLREPVTTRHDRPANALTSMVRVPAGSTALGMSRDAGRFGWDNEFGELRVDVPAFEIDRHMVTNGAFLAFMEAGGYRERAWWSDKDWTWKEAERITHPACWSLNDDTRARNGNDGNVSDVGPHPRWSLRTMFDEVPLPLDWPVYVSHAEASAYARWAGKSLPSEAQWQRAAHGAPHAASGNFDFRAWDPQPVDAHPDNVSAFGVEGQFGNGWEWTSTIFDALPDFEAFPFYPGYSANFFDGQHYVIKGGSARTAQCMLRPAFRNWFQPHYQYVYAGFRCVKT